MQENSWLANKLIRMRGLVYNWIKLRVESGSTCRFWSDNWSPFGSLSKFLPTTNNSKLDIPLNSHLNSLNNHGRWLIPSARSENQVTFLAYLTTISLTDREDYYEWEIQGQIYNRFKTGIVYSQLVDQSPDVPWYRAVWIKGGIPRQSFLCWLFTLSRSPTKDRILGWGIQTDPLCLLCNELPESRDHRIASRSQTHANRNWDASLSTIQSLTGTRERRLSLLA